ncbi:alpha/beta hydrolase fold domain-containing protein [Vagococcus entomophilus]|uniref:Alpha/beta hydrolase fold-3 domain-containing protein n=1 Tax=Vagococcus entomophilus TaxID=1160095 RepID=A0A430AL93_9ENTE|nr:alpha/beta hydrolase [Vagococcus entomophilus]RSU08647.1 hypothetical protein CBF30_05315 [Vagococcus entomophilus]
MKKKMVWLGASVLAVAAGIKHQAKKKKQSVSSLMIEQTLKQIPIFPDVRKPKEYQKLLEKSEAGYTLPDYVRSMYNACESKELKNTIVIKPKNKVSQRTIFYLHGGAYWFQPMVAHFRMLSKLAESLEAQIIMPIYPKAPSYHAEDVHKMVAQTYDEMLEKVAVDPAHLTFMGDSAGGGLALSFLQVLKETKKPMPQRAILLSPWLDVTGMNPQIRSLQKKDPMLPNDRLSYCGQVYAGALSTYSPLVSPLFGELSDLPPIDVFVGTHDILYADAKALEEQAKEEQLPIRIWSYRHMNHVFVTYPIPEAKEALTIIKNLILS